MVSVWEEIIAVTLSHSYCHEISAMRKLFYALSGHSYFLIFYAQSQNCEKLLSASSCLSVD